MNLEKTPIVNDRYQMEVLSHDMSMWVNYCGKEDKAIEYAKDLSKNDKAKVRIYKLTYLHSVRKPKGK